MDTEQRSRRVRVAPRQSAAIEQGEAAVPEKTRNAIVAVTIEVNHLDPFVVEQAGGPLKDRPFVFFHVDLHNEIARSERERIEPFAANVDRSEERRVGK